MKKMINIALIGMVTILFTACTNSVPVLPDSPSFKQGNKDGCATAKGSYTKNSPAFNGSSDYQDGWYYGRKHCHSPQ